LYPAVSNYIQQLYLLYRSPYLTASKTGYRQKIHSRAGLREQIEIEIEREIERERDEDAY
jgi:hypothetical protein